MGCNSSKQQAAVVDRRGAMAAATAPQKPDRSSQEDSGSTAYSAGAGGSPPGSHDGLDRQDSDDARAALLEEGDRVEELTREEPPRPQGLRRGESWIGAKPAEDGRGEGPPRPQGLPRGESWIGVTKPAERPAVPPVGSAGREPETAPTPSFWQTYRNKLRGAGAAGPPVPTWSYSAVSWVGSFTGIGTLGLIHTYLLPQMHAQMAFLPQVMLVGSFGAMAVLVFGQPAAPPSQPWNAICGNCIGGLVGVVVYEGAAALGLGGELWLTGGLAVSLTIVGQERAQAQHPPGGATALLFTLMPNLQELHYAYVICPALLGAVIFVLLSMLINNLSEARSYPISTHPLDLEPAPTPKPDPQAQARELAAVPDAGGQPQKPPVAPAPAQGFLSRYLGKWRGKQGPPMPQPVWSQTGFSWLGAFLGIATLGLLQKYAMPIPQTGIVLLVGSFGAMSVLVYSMPGAPFSQPKNVLMGNTLGGLVGVIVYKSCLFCGLGQWLWLMSALAVSLTIVAQERSSSVHPPGGATALIFIIRSVASNPEHPDRSFYIAEMSDVYVFCPGFLGAAVLVIVALLVNNFSEKRSYPGRWWS